MAHLVATKELVKRLISEGRLKASKAAQVGGFASSFNKITFDYRRFNQYGLYEDDILRETDVVKNALKRLPKDVYQERMYRIARAIDLSAKQRVLPKEEWTKAEEDLPYLRAFVDDCLKEEKEKEDWDNGNINL